MPTPYCAVTESTTVKGVVLVDQMNVSAWMDEDMVIRLAWRRLVIWFRTWRALHVGKKVKTIDRCAWKEKWIDSIKIIVQANP